MASDILDGEGRMIFVAVYRPHTGKDGEFRKLLKEHEPTLRRLGLITERPTIIMQAQDGSYIEIKEWAKAVPAPLPTNTPKSPQSGKRWEKLPTSPASSASLKPRNSSHTTSRLTFKNCFSLP